MHENDFPIPRRCSARLLLAALLLTPFCALAEGYLKPLKSGYWEGGAVDNQGDGQADYCQLAAYNKQGFAILLIWMDQGLLYGMTNPAWKLNAGKHYEVELAVDKSWSDRQKIKATDKDTLAWLVGRDTGAIEALQAGSRFKAKGKMGKYATKLTGTRKAIDALRDCYETEVAALAPSTPARVPARAPAPAPAPAPAAAESPAAQEPGTSSGPVVSRAEVVTTQPVSLRPLKDSFQPGEAISVGFSGLPARGQDWLALAELDHAPDQYYETQMLQGKPTSGEHSFGGLPMGVYEVRAFVDWPEGGYEVAASTRVTVVGDAVVEPAPPVAVEPPPAPMAKPEEPAAPTPGPTPPVSESQAPASVPDRPEAGAEAIAPPAQDADLSIEQHCEQGIEERYESLARQNPPPSELVGKWQEMDGGATTELYADGTLYERKGKRLNKGSFEFYGDVGHGRLKIGKFGYYRTSIQGDVLVSENAESRKKRVVCYRKIETDSVKYAKYPDEETVVELDASEIIDPKAPPPARDRVQSLPAVDPTHGSVGSTPEGRMAYLRQAFAISAGVGKLPAEMQRFEKGKPVVRYFGLLKASAGLDVFDRDAPAGWSKPQWNGNVFRQEGEFAGGSHQDNLIKAVVTGRVAPDGSAIEEVTISYAQSNFDWQGKTLGLGDLQYQSFFQVTLRDIPFVEESLEGAHTPRIRFSLSGPEVSERIEGLQYRYDDASGGKTREFVRKSEMADLPEHERSSKPPRFWVTFEFPVRFDFGGEVR